MSRAKGQRYERELAGEFQDAGWFVQNASISGASTDRELPDLIAGRDGHTIVMELKFTSDNIIYVDDEKVAGLKWVAEMLGAKALIVGRWKYDTTYYGFIPDACERLNSGKYKVHRDDRESGIAVPPGIE